MQQLTERQKSVHSFIAEFQREHGYSPTMQEIARHLSISGNLGVIRHLTALEKKGYLTRTPGSSRSIRLTSSLDTSYPETAERMLHSEEQFSIFLPVVGVVRAGEPQPPVEDIEEYRSIDRSIARSGAAFFLRVKGDSMVGAGVLGGDLALIRPQQTANNRDMVVVAVDGEATLKWFFREQDHIRLQPDNAAMQPIIVMPDRQIEIIGKVVGLYRTMA
ncbi:MAG: transcriptional repressor LexA [Desulfuromonadaceae bacterium]|nr:transcriptional repressor LexA [Desulfuromonadaceae bacterium]MDD5106692.1 transcriptional repressor LexA [Desulfuromonadaceae bacterium]